jgi:hypothetical protein
MASDKLLKRRLKKRTSKDDETYDLVNAVDAAYELWQKRRGISDTYRWLNLERAKLRNQVVAHKRRAE